MKKIISIIVLGALPVIAMAGGGHSGSHATSNHNTDGHNMSSGKMKHGSMSDMSHDNHEASTGRPGDPVNVTRTIEVTMDDNMRFTPNQLQFDAGETVRFVVRNNGKIRHEMVIGSVDELKEHADMMRTKPTMQHAESNMVSLTAGERGEIIWQFDNAGAFDFACLVPGHLEAGMSGKILVN